VWWRDASDPQLVRISVEEIVDEVQARIVVRRSAHPARRLASPVRDARRVGNGDEVRRYRAEVTGSVAVAGVPTVGR
jgi:hypothetical protein